MKGIVILGTLLLASTCFGAEKINTASAGGFGGKVTVEVTTEGEKIKDFESCFAQRNSTLWIELSLY